jgi:hypothetical protein
VQHKGQASLSSLLLLSSPLDFIRRVPRPSLPGPRPPACLPTCLPACLRGQHALQSEEDTGSLWSNLPLVPSCRRRSTSSAACLDRSTGSSPVEAPACLPASGGNTPFSRKKKRESLVKPPLSSLARVVAARLYPPRASTGSSPVEAPACLPASGGNTPFSRKKARESWDASHQRTGSSGPPRASTGFN